MTRSLRRIAAVLAAAALAFSQLAVSAHACEVAAKPVAAASTSQGDCCEKLAVNLCERHCDYGASSVDSHGAMPQVAAPSAPSLRVEPASLAAPAPTTATSRPGARRFEPPPLTRFGVLRI